MNERDMVALIQLSETPVIDGRSGFYLLCSAHRKGLITFREFEALQIWWERLSEREIHRILLDNLPTVN